MLAFTFPKRLLNILGLATATPDVADSVPFYDASASLNRRATLTDFRSMLSPCYANPSGFRLSPTSGDPYHRTGASGVSTLYYAIHNGDYLLVPNTGASDFNVVSPGQLNWSVSISSGQRKDLFVWNNSGTYTITPSSAWTNNTTRADALGTLKGIDVNDGTIGSMPAGRGIYIGTVYGSGTNTVEISNNKVFIWNRFNRLPWAVRALEASASWTYATATIRQANASTANQIEWICGKSGGTVFDGKIIGFCNVASSDAGWVRFGVDSTTAYETTASGIQFTPGTFIGVFASELTYQSPIGYHYASWLEKANGNTVTFYSNVNSMASGITGIVWQ